MRRSKGKRSHAPENQASSVPTIVTGSIREPGEAGELAVTLTMSASRVVMRADTLEIGDWPLDHVEIVPDEDGTFSFVAEGDTLVFMADDPQGLRQLLVREPDKPKRRRGRRKDKQQASETSGPHTIAGEAEATARPVRDDSRPPTKEAKGKPTDRVTDDSRRDSLRTGTQYTRETTPSADKKDGRWIRTLDTARRYGMFSLDRVPVDESLRGKEHRHTYDHRAAASSGPGKHICTICGKITR
jgi:hypothetical protein